MKRNEYGIPLDRNGYAPSIVQQDTEHCYLCGRCDEKLDRHEPFNGPFRDKSKAFGMWMTLCNARCHHGDAHRHYQTAQRLKKEVQAAAMKTYEWDTEEFVERFGKNWL